MEVEDESTWWAGIEKAEAEFPGCVALYRWSRGRCFPSREAAQAAMDAETQTTSAPVVSADDLHQMVNGGPVAQGPIPYEDVPDGPFERSEDVLVCGGLQYLALTVNVGGQKRPALGLRLIAADGGMMPMVALVLADDDMLALPDGIRKAIRSARREAARG